MSKQSTRACIVDENGDIVQGSNPLQVAMGEGVHMDAFGRQRVSNPLTIFDSKQVFDNQPLFWDDVQESGGSTTSVHDADAARTRIGVANTTAGKRTRQTFMRFNYQPGKSQLILMTTRMSSDPAAGVVAEVGLMDDDNGVFFRMNGTVFECVIRSNVTGTPVETAVAQADFNMDSMEGDGPSSITLDPTKANILWLDMEWLGVGTVRMGVVVDGVFHVMHAFDNANNLDSVYMSTPNLPLRYSIENDGTGAATTLDALCASVISEGGSDHLGAIRSKTTGTTAITCAAVGTIYPILGIRLKTTHLGAQITPLSVDMLDTAGSKAAEWTLIMNPTLSAPLTYGNETNSAVQSAIGDGIITVTGGGTVLAHGYWQSTNRGGTSGEELINAIRIGATIAGVADQLVLCVTPLNGINPTVFGTLSYREVP